MRFRAVVLAIAALLCAEASAEDNIEAGRIKAYTCGGCHGIEGYNNVYPTYKVPKIGGQSPAYLSAALQAYRDGNRPHPTMQAQANSLSTEDTSDIVAWLAQIQREAPETADDAEPPAASQVCQACHGPQGLGADPSYPVLAGQHPSYLSKALTDYRSGARQNAVMAGFAAQLSDEDIEILSDWYATRPGLRDLSDQ